jgi:Tol biopolymer transport system component
MSLIPGTRLGPYEIMSRIGVGGMGEVYKARDTRLDRTVAIKVLRSDQTTDPAAKRRFDREARAVAALSHPHICPLFDIGHQEGTDYLVMEYLDGETLAARLARGKLPFDQALQYGVQVVDGLAAAHGAGIIHRDLKPGNIMLKKTGAKLLDFGLGKPREHAAVAGMTEGATQEPLSGAGMIVGTLPYIAPEQLQGKEADTRTDIFAVGVVLYEMLTGRRAFEGSGVAALIGNILHAEPSALSLAEPAASPALERLVGKCLSKNPDARWQSALDLNSELQQIAVHERRSIVPANRFRLSLALLATVALAIAASLAWRFLRPSGVSVPRAEVLPVTTLAGDEMRPALSPDGSQIAFFWGGEKSNDGGLYITMSGSPEMRRLTVSPNHDNFPRWSPDGQRIAFVRFSFREYAGGRVHTVSPLGGPHARLSDFPAQGPVAWSPDGRHIAASRWAPEESREPTGIFLIPVAGGEPRPLTDTRGPFRDTGLAFSPDGRQLAYASCTPSCDVYISAVDLAFTPVGPRRRLTAQALSSIGLLAWARDGKSVIYDSSVGGFTYLSRVAIDGTRPPERVELAGLNAFAPATAASADRLVFSRHSFDSDVYRWEPGRRTEPVIASSFPDEDPAFAPRGDRIAYASARSGRAAEIWVAASDGSGAQRLVEGPGRWQTSPQWSPDGGQIAFDSFHDDGSFHIWIVDAMGGVPRQRTTQSGNQRFPTWSHDGRWIYYCNESTEWDIWRVPATGGTPERLTRTGNAIRAYESPDGKSLLYQARRTSTSSGWDPLGNGQVLVVPLEGGRPEELVSCAVAGSLSVGPPGIYYVSCRDYWTREGAALHSLNLDTGQRQLVGTLDGFLPHRGVAVSPDGQQILYVRARGHGVDVFLIENFR